MLWLLPRGTVRCPRCKEGFFEIDDGAAYLADRPARPVAPVRTSLRVVQDGWAVQVPRPTVVIDAAEHMGYTFNRFPKLFEGAVRKRLKFGDYSLVGFEEVLAVERKTLPDLVGSIIANRQDFIAKCERLSSMKRKCLVVEATLSQVKSRYPNTEAHPNAVLGSLVAAQERWGIPVHFLDNQKLAEEFVASVLSKWHAYEWLEANGKRRQLIDGDI